MRLLEAKKMLTVKGGDTCTNLQAGIFVAMSLLQFEIAAALAATWWLLGCNEM